VVPAVEAAPDPAAPQAAAPDVVAAEPAASIAEIQPAAADTTAEVTDTAAETLDPPAPGVLSSTDTAAFAQDVPAGEAPRSEPVLAGEDAADTAALAATIMRPPPPADPGTGLSTIVDRGTNGRLEVALTFDAGADTGYAAEILDLLRDEGIEATFGMTGVWAQANPELVRRMVAEGHQLMNHTWDHSSLTGANTQMPPLSPEQVAQQLGDTEAIVRDLTGGYEMRPYFRPPYGDYDAASLEYLHDHGYALSIWWTCDTRGWAGWGAQEIVDYCTTNIAEDEILLLHVGAAAVGDFEALPGLIQFFRDSGYDFVTIEQMLQP
jgi:peptidoglycan/xylan/chitin deacetylase (PgdA/CDA1 family)